MAIPDWVKHMIGAGVLVGVVGYAAEKYVQNNDGLNEQQKKMIMGTAIGMAGGGAAGYYVGEKVIDGKIPDCRKKKIIGAAVGAASGGVAGYFIGRRAGTGKTGAEKSVSVAPAEIIDAVDSIDAQYESKCENENEKPEGGN